MKVMPFAGFCFIVAAMASAGLPGFANFVSELMVIIGAWQSDSLFTKIPAVLAVWGLVLTGVYLLRAVKDVWYGDMPERWKDLKDATRPIQKLPFIVLMGVLVWFGFRPQPMIDLAEDGVRPILTRIQEAEAAAAGGFIEPLAELLADEAMRARAAQWQARLAAVDGPARAAEALRQFVAAPTAAD